MEYLIEHFPWLSIKFINVPLSSYICSFLAILGGFIAKLVLGAVCCRAKKIVEKTKFPLDDILLDSLSTPLQWFAVFAGLYIAAAMFPLPEEPFNVAKFVSALFKGVSVLFVVWILVRFTDGLAVLWSDKARKRKSKLEIQVAPIVNRSLNVFLIATGVLIFLQNMGYSVGGLLAGLGIGGMAVALASKDTLSNLFGAIVIFVDRPFQVGDWVELGDLEGTVEEIKLRTTKIRTFANSLITLPNASLTTTAINNWSRMKKRRIKMTVGVTYSTPADRIEKAVQAIRDIIENDEAIKNDFYLVYLDNFGPSSIDIFIYCFTGTTVWGEFLAAKEKFMLKIIRAFQELGVEMAFPTQTVHVASLPPQAKM